jgi:hypothetical protein
MFTMQQAHRVVKGIRLHRLAHPSCETFRALAEGHGHHDADRAR